MGVLGVIGGESPASDDDRWAPLTSSCRLGLFAATCEELEKCLVFIIASLGSFQTNFGVSRVLELLVEQFIRVALGR